MSGVVVKIIANNLTVAMRTTDANGFWQVRGPARERARRKSYSGRLHRNRPGGGAYSGTASGGQANQNLNFGLKPACAARRLYPRQNFLPLTMTKNYWM